MNVGEVGIVPKSILIPSLMKNTSIDFKELVLSLFMGEKSENKEETTGDISSLIFTLINNLELSKGEVGLDKSETRDISNLIKDLNWKLDLNGEEIVRKLNALVEKGEFKIQNSEILDLITEIEDIPSFVKELKEEPREKDKPITKEEFKEKMISLIQKNISGEDNVKLFKETSLDSLGDFKKNILIYKNYDLLKSNNIEIETDVNKDINTLVNNLIKIESKQIIQNEKIDIPVINEISIKEDIVKSISFMKENDIKNLTVKITPKELGEITIALSFSESKITGEITATNKNAFNLINNNILNINSELSRTGLNIENVTLSSFSSMFSERGEERGREGDNRSSKRDEKGILTDPEIGEISDINSNLNIFA